MTVGEYVLRVLVTVHRDIVNEAASAEFRLRVKTKRAFQVCDRAPTNVVLLGN